MMPIPDKQRVIERAQALAIYCCVREGYSREARRIAVEQCAERPVAALHCYEAIINSLPQGER